MKIVTGGVYKKRDGELVNILFSTKIGNVECCFGYTDNNPNTVEDLLACSWGPEGNFLSEGQTDQDLVELVEMRGHHIQTSGLPAELAYKIEREKVEHLTQALLEIRKITTNGDLTLGHRILKIHEVASIV